MDKAEYKAKLEAFDIKNFKLEYENLNDCVAALLKKAKEDN